MRGVTIAVYLMCALALAATEVAARYTTRSVPTFGVLLRWAARRRSTQIGLVMGWWWIGWHFLGSGA